MQHFSYENKVLSKYSLFVYITYKSIFVLSKYYKPWSHTGTQRLDEMLPNVYSTTNETLVNIPSNLHLQLADWLISLGRLCT